VVLFVIGYVYVIHVLSQNAASGARLPVAFRSVSREEEGARIQESLHRVSLVSLTALIISSSGTFENAFFARSSAEISSPLSLRWSALFEELTTIYVKQAPYRSYVFSSEL
jgi:hypothetical protein